MNLVTLPSLLHQPRQKTTIAILFSKFSLYLLCILEEKDFTAVRLPLIFGSRGNLSACQANTRSLCRYVFHGRYVGTRHGVFPGKRKATLPQKNFLPAMQTTACNTSKSSPRGSRSLLGEIPSLLVPLIKHAWRMADCLFRVHTSVYAGEFS